MFLSNFSFSNILRNKVYIYYLASASIVVVVAVGAFYFSSKPKTPKSYQLTGAVSRVVGNSVFVKNGVLVINQTQYVKAPETEVVITSQTKITVSAITRPLTSDLLKNNGVWDMKNIKPVVTTGSLKELSSSLGTVVSVKSSTDIFGKKKFQADSVSYSIIRDNPLDKRSQIPNGFCDDTNGVNIGAVACKKKIADFLNQP